MPLVEISIAGRRHAVQCDDGQEARLRRLSAYLDSKATELARATPSLSEARVLLLAGLLVTDELFDAYDELQRLRARVDSRRSEDEEQAAAAIERVAERLERLASALETT
jgi:cell division protein ZapA